MPIHNRYHTPWYYVYIITTPAKATDARSLSRALSDLLSDTRTTPNLLPTATVLSICVSSTSTPVALLRGRVPRSRSCTRQTRSTPVSRETSPFAICSSQLCIFLCFILKEEEKYNFLCEFLHPKRNYSLVVERERSDSRARFFDGSSIDFYNNNNNNTRFCRVYSFLCWSFCCRVRKRGGLLLRATLCSSTKCTKNRKERRRRSPFINAKMVDDDDDDDLSRQPNVLPLSSSMLPPPLIDRRGFFGTTFDDLWVPRCRETVRNASRAAALNMREI